MALYEGLLKVHDENSLKPSHHIPPTVIAYAYLIILHSSISSQSFASSRAPGDPEMFGEASLKLPLAV